MENFDALTGKDVLFSEKMDEYDAVYADEGMKATILKITVESDGLVCIRFSYKKFDAENDLVAKSDFYLPNGGMGTGKEAGFYTEEEDIWFEDALVCNGTYFTVVV